MPVGNRGPNLAGLAALLTLCVVGPGCQTSGGPGCLSCQHTPGRPPAGLIANIQAMTTSLPSLPSGPIFGSPRPPAAPLAVAARTAHYGTTPPPAYGGNAGARLTPQPQANGNVQTAGGRQTSEPGLASHIPTSAGQTGVLARTGGPAATTPPITKIYLPPVAQPVAPPPSTFVVTPGLPHPVSKAMAHIHAKINDYTTADAIRYAPPVPHGVPREFDKRSLPPYIIEPPDILLIESTAGLEDQRIRGQHLVRPDGSVGLGIYGEVSVAGLTIAQAKERIIAHLAGRLKDIQDNNTNVDVLAYNSKRYYIITDGGGYGEQVYPFPITGNETVLDALGNIYGLPIVASKRNIWVARATPDGSPPKILPVDWKSITQYGTAGTNFQILPGDRIYVQAQHAVRLDSTLARILAPIDRLFGSILLGGSGITAARGAFR